MSNKVAEKIRRGKEAFVESCLPFELLSASVLWCCLDEKRPITQQDMALEGAARYTQQHKQEALPVTSHI